ncbi:tetratricopeptide repeat protein [Nitrosomonadales bacterium]|nr:tetratricopeptide repeat protein [Nitrosomonadales bacterium]
MKIKKFYFPLFLIATLFINLSSNLYAGNNREEIKILLKNGKYSRAEKLVNESIKETPNNPEFLFYRGIIETNIGKNNEAIETFRNLTENFPELPEPFNNLAVLYAEKGQFKLAKEILERAIKTNPSYLTAHINLGDIYTKMASEAYNKALEIDKANNIAITKLSMITQLFNYQPNTKNTEIKSAKIKEAKEAKEAKQTKKELTNDISNAIIIWKTAWENKNMEGYLDAYAANFQYPNNMSRSDWEAYREVRITSKKTINILISNIELKFEKDKIIATFNQDYKSGKLEQISKKTLVFINEDSKWVIFEETSG